MAASALRNIWTNFKTVTSCVLCSLLLAPTTRADTVCYVEKLGEHAMCYGDVIVVNETTDTWDRLGVPTITHDVRFQGISDGVLNYQDVRVNNEKEDGGFIRIKRSTPDESHRIIQGWVSSGTSALVTGLTGDDIRIHNAGLDFVAPPNRSIRWLGGHTSEPSIQIRRGREESDIKLADITTIEVQPQPENSSELGFQVVVTLSQGRKITGMVVTPRISNSGSTIEFMVPALGGVEDTGTLPLKTVVTPFSKIKKIVFNNGPNRRGKVTFLLPVPCECRP